MSAGGILGLDPVKGDQVLVDRYLYPGLRRARWFELTEDPRPAADGTIWVRGRLAPFLFLGETQYGQVVDLHITYPAGLVVQRAAKNADEPAADPQQPPPVHISAPAPSWFLPSSRSSDVRPLARPSRTPPAHARRDPQGPAAHRACG